MSRSKSSSKSLLRSLLVSLCCPLLISACGGGGASDPVAAPVADGRDTLSQVGETQVTTPSGTWTLCALEGQTCSFTGTRPVRYGTATQNVVQSFTGQVACSNAVFGDPIVGTAKSCWTFAQDAGTTTAWTTCASEGQYCTFSGTRTVRYGIATNFVVATMTGGTACSNGQFGDPAVGTVKACSYSTTIADATPTFWGAAPSTALSYAPQTWLPDAAAAGVTTVRGFDAGTNVDNLKPILDAGMTASGILWWSSPNAPGTLPINDLAGWRAYVTSMVTRYRGRVQNWEVWNEPPNFTTDPSPASYGAVVAAAYDAAKAVDPTIHIGLAAKSNHVNYLAQAIDGGAANKFDFVTLHPYENAGLLAQGFEGQFMSLAPRVRTMLQDRNAANANVPIWFSEIGVQVATSTTTGVTPEAQADALVKIYTMGAAQGISRVDWFSPRDAEGETLGLEAADGTKRPAYVAQKTLSRYLGSVPSFVGWIEPGGAWYGFVFEGPSGTVLCAWTPPGVTSAMTLSSTATRIDPRTGATISVTSSTLTSVPQLFVVPSSSSQAITWKAQAAANDGAAFGWYGVHRASTSVSLSASTGPAGVAMVGAPAPTVVNGVAEINVEGSNAVLFTVDPEFLSYTTRPITVTAVLRGHGTGSPGFNLKYESNAPLASTDGNGLVASTAGWHQIGSTKFYQKSWVITNPRFVGFYGYNFTFDSDGLSHSQYSIQSVTVTKM